MLPPAGSVAVIFVSRRTPDHSHDYDAMGARMEELVREQPGYLHHVSVRDPRTGDGITVAYFADDASARAWKAHPEHRRAQELGATSFYDSYDVAVAEVTRAYSGPSHGAGG